MQQTFPALGRYISILDRLMKMYYDHGLSDFQIGWDSKFLEYLGDTQGLLSKR